MFLKKGDPEFDEYHPENDDDPEVPKDKKLVLEEQPKWNLLKVILEEISNDSLSLNHGEGAPVLIMVAEKRTCSQLKHYITAELEGENHQPFLRRLAKSYFKWNKGMSRMQPTPAPAPQPQPQMRFRGGAPPNKRRRVRGGSANASVSSGRQQPLSAVFKDDVIHA